MKIKCILWYDAFWGVIDLDSEEDPLKFPQPSGSVRVQKDMIAVAAIERDAELMLRVREGDTESFEILLSKHRGPVIHFLYRMVQNQAVAEELAQEVFLRVYKSRGNYEPTAKFTTWLFRITSHLALNHIRDSKNERGQGSIDESSDDGLTLQVPDRGLNTEQTLVNKVRLDEVRRAIQGLPEKQRAAVLMHKYQEMEYAQIASVLESTESAVKSLLFRAYETLRVRLAHMAP